MVLSCKTQGNIQQNINKNDVKTWYFFSSEGELGNCTFYDDKIVFKSSVNSNNNNDTTTLFIEKRLDNQYLIVRNNDRKPPYAIISIEITDRSILNVASTTITGTSIDEVEEKFNKNPIPIWVDLTGRDCYTKKQIDQLEKAPGLDELTREDLLTSLQWRQPLSEKLKAYLEDNGDNGRFRIYRFVENYRNQRLVELGYNPYKQVTYNLYKRFKEDEEIMRLLNEEIKF